MFARAFREGENVLGNLGFSRYTFFGVALGDFRTSSGDVGFRFSATAHFIFVSGTGWGVEAGAGNFVCVKVISRAK